VYEKLYQSAVGRFFASIIARPGISRAAGLFMDSRLSCFMIKPFISRNTIDMRDVLPHEYKSFNEFFTRRLNPGARSVVQAENRLASPCDGLLSVYPITEDGVFTVKGTPYTVETLLESKQIAEEFMGGWAMIFRLTPAHYHRYAFPDSGEYVFTKSIQGVFHTVRPEALKAMPVFKKNTREYAFLKTDHFGSMIYMEVGATMVGRIANLRHEGTFARGEEKGMFEFGGSTVILMLKKDVLKPDEELIQNTINDVETPVMLGQSVAVRIEV